jgi:N-glycosylase/DNA lyase
LRSTSPTSSDLALPLRGGGGEPVDFYRTITSHGLAHLPPAALDREARTYSVRLRIGKKPVLVTLREQNGELRIDPEARLSERERAHVRNAVSRMFRLGDDLTPFYAAIASDPLLQWAAAGAGRLLASPTVFEDVVKTICTTNCAWSATVRMTSALVALGEGTFPDAALLAQTPERWYADVARMGYRGPYVRAIAKRVASGELDLERLLPRVGLSDDQVEEALLALPGVGPYAAAHIMQLLGRHEQLILDSWTRPTFLRIAKKKQAKDSTIARAFARYGRYAGLAFWLFLTHDWE